VLGDLGARAFIENMLLLWEDIRYGLRILARSPGFTAVALISLSLGFCIATCADSEMNGIILRNIPAITKPDQLVGTQTPISYPYYKPLSRTSRPLLLNARLRRTGSAGRIA
jgi:hypothetical protein